MTAPQDIDELENVITAECRAIFIETFRNESPEFEHRVSYCLDRSQ